MGEGKEAPPLSESFNSDRRKHPKYPVHLRIEYPKAGNGKSGAGRVGNISEGGVLLYLSDWVEIGQTLRLKIFAASGTDG